MDPKDLLNLATFADEPPPGYVRREGLIFECGDYPDKKFSLSPDEADAAIAAFAPVYGDLEHMPTVLSGNLGILREMRRDGNAIFGTADVPEWLNNVLKGTASSISCAWDRVDKTLKGWGWVLDPAVKGAALMSAYAEFRTEQDRLSVNSLPTPVAPIAPLPTRPSRNNTKEKRNMMTIGERLKARWAQFSAADPTAPTAPTTITPPTTPTPTAPTTPTTPVTTDPPVAPTPVAPQPTAPGTPATPPASFSAPGLDDGEIDEATADFKASRIIAQATNLVDALVQAGHIHSSGRNAWIACFTSAGYTDEADGPSIVTFARHDGAILNSRVDMLSEALRHVPQHTLFTKTLPVQVLNGNRSAAETKTAEQAADEQAARFNQQMGVQPATTANMTNNGNAH